MVKWETVCMPKKAGGLGIRSAKAANQVSMAKLTWRLCTEQDKLWSQMITAKYGIKNVLTVPGKKNSPTLNAMKIGFKIFMEGIRWLPGSGHSILFWNHSWILEKPLFSVLFGPWRPSDLDLHVDQVWVNWAWDLDRIAYPLPEELLFKINAIFVSESLEEDALVWNNSSTGQFCSKSAYSMAMKVNPSDKSSEWIWDINYLPKIKYFLWMASLGKIPTFNVLHGRDIDTSILCPQCKSDVENPYPCPE